MRETKFRVWDKIQRVMHYAGERKFSIDLFGRLYDDEDQFGEGVERYVGYRMILLEYIGLKDKKRTEEYPEGQEIYEGDIINYTEDGEQLRMVVRFVSQDNLTGYDLSYKDEPTVIGNMYEGCKDCAPSPNKTIPVDDVHNPRCPTCGKELLK